MLDECITLAGKSAQLALMKDGVTGPSLRHRKSHHEHGNRRIHIHIAPAAETPMLPNQVVAIPGVGLEGDRYALGKGTFSKPEPDFELTLIEAEAIEALQREYNVELAPADARRNLVTRGVALNHLVGRDFQIGEVKAHGIRRASLAITCSA